MTSIFHPWRRDVPANVPPQAPPWTFQPPPDYTQRIEQVKQHYREALFGGRFGGGQQPGTPAPAGPFAGINFAQVLIHLVNSFMNVLPPATPATPGNPTPPAGSDPRTMVINAVTSFFTTDILPALTAALGGSPLIGLLSPLLSTWIGQAAGGIFDALGNIGAKLPVLPNNPATPATPPPGTVAPNMY